MLWRPDTCECEIEILDNSYWSNPSGQNGRFIKRCPAHPDAGIADILTENRGKNTAWSKIIEAVAPDIAINLTFTYDKGRNLSVGFETITLPADKKAQIEVLLGSPLTAMYIGNERKAQMVTGFGAVIKQGIESNSKVQQELDKTFGVNTVKIL